MQVAFFLLILAPVLLIVMPLLLAYRKDRKAKAARFVAPDAGTSSD
jgi:hypothetical protein